MELSNLSRLCESARKSNRTILMDSLNAIPLSPTDGYELFICPLNENVLNLWKKFQSSAISSPFQRVEWILGWLKNHQADIQSGKINPTVILAFRQDDLVMLFPFAIERGFLNQRLTWLASEFNDYNAPVICKHEIKRLTSSTACRIFNTIFAFFKNVDFALLDKQPAKIAGFKNPFVEQKSKPFSANAHALKLTSDWPDVYTSRTSSRRRQQDRNKIRRLQKSGNVKLVCIRSPIERSALITKTIQWKQQRLQEQGAPKDPFKDGKMQAIINSVVLDPASSDLVRVYALKQGDRIVAATIGLLHRKSFNLFITSFNPNLGTNCSPGRILIVKLLELLTRAGRAELDFSIGDEPYKFDWCNAHMNLSYQTRGLSTKGKLLAKLAAIKIDLKRFIKNKPILLDTLQRLNQHKPRPALLWDPIYYRRNGIF